MAIQEEIIIGGFELSEWKILSKAKVINTNNWLWHFKTEQLKGEIARKVGVWNGEGMTSGELNNDAPTCYFQYWDTG